jgi:hypothetical protein
MSNNGMPYVSMKRIIGISLLLLLLTLVISCSNMKAPRIDTERNDNDISADTKTVEDPIEDITETYQELDPISARDQEVDQKTRNQEMDPISATNPEMDPISATNPEIDPISATNPEVEPIPATSQVKDSEKPNFDEFQPLRDSFVRVDFEVKREGRKDEPKSFIVTRNYDLNRDGHMDKIKVSLLGIDGANNTLPYIEVNGIRQEFYMDYTLSGEVQILDLDESDNFHEIACFDEGPSDDPHYHFFRYDGTKLYEIGEIDAYAYMDGKGKLISGFHISHFTPKFYSAWYQVEENQLVFHSNTMEPYLGKAYEFEGGKAYFLPFDEMPEEVEFQWEELIQFEPGKLNLIDVYILFEDNPVLNHYFVEFEDGKRGLLYFWIGD